MLEQSAKAYHSSCRGLAKKSELTMVERRLSSPTENVRGT